MNTVVFDGEGFAKQKEKQLLGRVDKLVKKPKLFVVVFEEDLAGLIYAELKSQAAQRLGIGFEKVVMQIVNPVDEVVEVIAEASIDPANTGVMVQKPMRRTWETNQNGKRILTSKTPPTTSADKQDGRYSSWWEQITQAIEPKKDVDCLTRTNLDLVYAGKSTHLPATAQACVDILDYAVGGLGIEAFLRKNVIKVGIVGRSELVGKPLAAKLTHDGATVKLLGSKDNLGFELPECDWVITATGVGDLIKPAMIKQGAVVIDVGAPKAEVDLEGVAGKACFVTPVPGGVGPVTVACLMEAVVL